MDPLNRRIGRIGFALGYLPILMLVIGLHNNPAYSSGNIDGDSKKYAVLIGILIWSICLTAWRCHDYNKSAWSNFWTEQVPLVGPIVGLWDLLSKPGDTGYTSYGPPPRF